MSEGRFNSVLHKGASTLTHLESAAKEYIEYKEIVVATYGLDDKTRKALLCEDGEKSLEHCLSSMRTALESLFGLL